MIQTQDTAFCLLTSVTPGHDAAAAAAAPNSSSSFSSHVLTTCCSRALDAQQGRSLGRGERGRGCALSD